MLGNLGSAKKKHRKKITFVGQINASYFAKINSGGGEVRNLSTKCKKVLIFFTLPLQVHNWLVTQKLLFGGR